MKKPANALKPHKSMNSNTLLLYITIVLFILLYAAGCLVYGDRGFTNLQTFLNLFRTNAGLICVACGITCVMLTGGIDISVGSLVALDCMLLAYGMSVWGLSAPVMILIVLAVGLVFGLVQGICVGYLQIQPFIVTMAGLFFARGMVSVISTEQLAITADVNQTFYDMASFRISLPFGGTVNRAGKVILPYIGIGVVIALVVLVLVSDAPVHQVRPLSVRCGRQRAVRGHDGPGCEAHQAEGLCALLPPVLHRRHLLLHEHHDGQYHPGHRHGDGRHLLRRHRRHAADRRRGQRDRHPVRRAHQRHHLHHRADQRQAGLLLAQHPDGRAAVLLHRAAEHFRPAQGKEQVRKALSHGTERNHRLRRAVLGIELGSTRIKAVLIGPDHTPIASGDHGWENRYEDGVWTYHMDDVWAGLQDAYRKLCADVEAKCGEKLTKVAAMGFSAMMHGYLPLDGNGALLVPFRTWRNTMTARRRRS